MASRRIGIVAVIASVLLAQSAFASPEERETAARSSMRPAMMITLGGTLADLFTTLSVLNSGSGRELNPLLGQDPGRIIVAKSALLVPQLLAERHLITHGHPKAAMWLGIAFGGLGTAMAIRNMNVGH